MTPRILWQWFAPLDAGSEECALSKAVEIYCSPYRLSKQWLSERDFSSIVWPDYPTIELCEAISSFVANDGVDFCIACTFVGGQPTDFTQFKPEADAFGSLPSRYPRALALVFSRSESFALLIADTRTVIAGPKKALPLMIGETLEAASARLVQRIAEDSIIGTELVDDVRYYDGEQRVHMGL